MTSVSRYIFRVISYPLLVLLLSMAALSIGGCNGSSDSTSSSDPVLSLQLDFVRNSITADGSFDLVVWLSNANDEVVGFAVAPTISSTRGLLSPLSVRTDKKWELTVTPDDAGTGEYTLTVSAMVSGQNVTVSRTVLVMGDVNSGWGQPMAVEGLVNTDGTQDSLVVSPDGDYLFLQYYPVALNCFLSGDPESDYCQVPRGPVAAPYRPNFPGADRVGLNSVHHGCPSLNFDPSPVPVPPIGFYGFHRQADGSYRQPVLFDFPGNDGCFTFWGPSIQVNGDGSYTMTNAFNDPRNANTSSDFAHLYTFDFTPGIAQNIAEVSYSGGIIFTDFIMQPLTIGGLDTHRGNPHVFYNNGIPAFLFYDDETQIDASKFIFVSSWNGSSWNTPVALDFLPFNASGFGDTQPFFDGEQLILREGSRLMTFPYDGGAINTASSWGNPLVLLAPQSGAVAAGNITIVAEPSMATIDGSKVLFFIYGLHQSDGSVNLRAGYVQREN
jgi:hypothetical protein